MNNIELLEQYFKNKDLMNIEDLENLLEYIPMLERSILRHLELKKKAKKYKGL